MTTENYIEEIHKLKLKIMDSFPDLLEFNNLIEMRDYLIRKSVKQEFLEDLKEFREIPSQARSYWKLS